jgi:hypothetical protein
LDKKTISWARKQDAPCWESEREASDAVGGDEEMVFDSKFAIILREKTWPFPEVTLQYGLVLEAALGFRMEALEEMGI